MTATGFKGITKNKQGAYKVEVKHLGRYAVVQKSGIGLEEAIKLQKKLRENIEQNPAKFKDLDELRIRHRAASKKYSLKKRKEMQKGKTKAKVVKPIQVKVPPQVHKVDYKVPCIVAMTIAIILAIFTLALPLWNIANK